MALPLRLWLKFMWYVIWGAICALFSCCLPRRSRFPDLSADVCVVTGAGQGLGRHIALQLSECGATLVLWDVNNDTVQAVGKEIRDSGGNAHCYVVDCSKREEVYRAAEQVREEVGDVAVLVNNAGVSFRGSFAKEEISDEQIVKSFSVNALAHYWTVRTFLPWMINNDYGYVVNVASVAGYVGAPYVSAYCATKAAVRSFSESLRHELELNGKRGISVMCVYPSFINTNMMDTALKEAAIQKGMPISEPEDVAQAIVYGMGEKKKDLFIFSSDKIAPILKTVVPSKALSMLAKETMDILSVK